MASVFRNKQSGKTRIQVTLADGSRKSLTLGRMTRKMEDEFCRRVEELETATRLGIRPDDNTLAWAMTVDPTHLAKLSEWKMLPVGLEARLMLDASGEDDAAKDMTDPTAVKTIGQLTAAFLKSREKAKMSSKKVWIRTKNLLVAHFGADRVFENITVGDAKEFRTWMRDNRKIATTTANKMISVCRQFFGYAIDFEWITKNPFVDKSLPTTVRSNKARQTYISRETTFQVIDACPSAEWRLLVAMARFGGVRMPSEVKHLRWDHVYWDQNRMMITSPKTEHHEGKETRIIPLFPELVIYLNELWDACAGEPADYVFSESYRKDGVNLRTQLERIIGRAGLKQWPKLWNNLRASCETDLMRKHPAHVVYGWMGNSERVAAEHYLQITDEDFETACAYCVQRELEQPRTAEKPKREDLKNPGDFRGLAESCDAVQMYQVDVTGLEPVTPTMSR